MVPGRTLFLVVSLFFLIFVYCSHNTFGETHDPNGSGDAVIRRLAPGDELTDRKISILSKIFQLPAEFVRQRYSDRFNKAMGSISQGDYNPLASIVAELFGTVNQRQLDTLLETVNGEKEAELKKTPPDTRFVGFLDKFILAANRIKDPESTPSSEDGAKFLQAFDSQFNRVKEANARFYEKLSQALNGNRQAQDFLKSNYDPKALLSFMDAQRTTGNPEVARSLAKSLAEREASGNHTIDVTGPQGKRERIELGSSDADVVFALEKFGSEQGFGGRSFSPQRHSTVDETFRYPRPTGGTDPVAPVKEAEPEKTVPADPKKTLETVPPPKAAIQPGAAAAFALMKAQCVRCHGPGKRQEKAFAMNENGSPKILTPQSITTILTRTLVDEDMPPSGPLEEPQKAVLRRWAQEQNVALPK